MKTAVLVSCVAALVVASAVHASERWVVIASAQDGGDQVAVAAAAKRRVTKLAVRVHVTGRPKDAEVTAFVVCTKASPFGELVRTRRVEFDVVAPAMRRLPLPVPYPENCGVTAIGIAHSVLRRVGNTIYTGRITVEILALPS